jgi:hypothetical protein
MDKQSRRQVIRDFKEAKTKAGVFAVRCSATGEAWLGTSKNLEQQQNAIWFSLKMGASGRLHPDLHAAYRQHGAEAIVYDVVEAIEELGTYGRDRQLKDRLTHWLAAMNAKKVFG